MVVCHMTVGQDKMDAKFDAPLLGILQTCGELEPFLDVVLGFLYRKTDFFFPLAADQSMGFPPGAAQAKLLKVFRKYEKMRDTVPLSPQAMTPPTPPVTPSNTSSTIPAPQPVLQPPPPPQVVPQPLPQPLPQPVLQPQSSLIDDNLVQGGCENVAAVETAGSIDEKEEIQGTWSTAAWDHHNGGFTEHYAWSQTAQDVELKLPITSNMKASDLTIDIKAHSIKVQRKSASGPVVMLEEKLHDPIKTEESMWSLHKGEYVQVTLEKARDGYWWTAMFDNGATVALDTIDTTRSIADFGQEEQACVQKLMFDQMRKQKGLSTSDEMNTEDILKKAWNSEGSPFAGTPYDPSQIKISTDGTMPGGGI